MKHRIRCAVILEQDERLLLVKHVDPDTKRVWWIPPGGGLEPGDRTVLDCARREVFEETGLRVEVGKLVYVREFREIESAAHHLELFFTAERFSGSLTLNNITGAGPDEDYIKGLSWLGREDLRDLAVFPEHLKSGYWEDLAQGFPAVQYLGVTDYEED